jgi:mannose-6-phosphate isomerase-like protein (cupin superfamily)
MSILRLTGAVRLFLESLPGPRVPAFLRGWPEPEVETRVVAPACLPVLHWLPPSGGCAPAVVAGLYEMRGALSWRQTYAPADFGAEFLNRYGWTELIGGRGPVASERLACGFLLLGPETEYPDHHHQAEEVYIVLSGTAAWRRGAEDWQARPPGEIIFHGANVPHAMRTGPEPLLALYMWRAGDLLQKAVIG